MENGKITLASFLGGGILGAGVALLLAPQSGNRTRRDIARMGKLGRNKCRSLQHDLRRNMENVLENVGEKVDDSLTEGKEWTRKTFNQVQRVFDQRVH